MMIYRYITWLLVLSSIASAKLEAQAIKTDFGKNRIQHHNDFNNWSRYETENFVTYWYGKSRNIAQPTIQLAELDFDEIQQIFEHTLSEKVEIIVYIDLTDLKQSNIGLEEAFTTKGQVQVEGNKVMIYFDGNHQNLRKNIRQGLATIYINSIVRGSSLQEVVQNSLLLNLPPWYSEGIIAYGASNWDHLIDDELRDLLQTKEKFREFKKFAEIHPRVSGHSFWYYISEIYGASSIANIIYLTRINKDIDNSFQYILDKSLEDIMLDWSTYFIDYYKIEQGKFVESKDIPYVKLKNKDGVPVSDMRYSSDGNLLAYAINDRDKTRVYLHNLKTGKNQQVLKVGHKNVFQKPDFGYPLLAWHPTYPELTILYQYKDVIKYRVLDLKSDTYEEETIPQNFQRIYSFDYIGKEEYLITASTDGYSDLYTFNGRTRSFKRITKDYHDDLDASVATLGGRRGILFRSNRIETDLIEERLDTILPIENFDIFFLKGFDKDADLVRITETPQINERLPLDAGHDKIRFVSNKTGVDNLYEYDYTTRELKQVTNLSRNVILHETDGRIDKQLVNYYYNGNYNTYNIKSEEDVDTYVTQYGNQKRVSSKDIVVPLLLEEEEEETSFEQGTMFQSQFDDPDDLKPLSEVSVSETSSRIIGKYYDDYFSNSFYDGKPILKYNPARASASRTRFRLHDFSTSANNDVLFQGLESFAGDEELTNPPLGILIKGEVKNLMEDYNIELGLRIPVNFRGFEYYVTIDDNKRLWDKRYAIYKRTETTIVDDNLINSTRQKRNTTLGLYRLKYPFDIYRSVRFTGSLRMDRFFSVATDLATFNEPILSEERASIKVEYVFDNSFDVLVNVKNGSRYKIYFEGINQFDLQFRDNLSFDPSLAVTGVFGIDARHYIPILRKSVLALRGSAAASFGSQRIVYYLGGVENWIGASFDETIQLPEDQDFSYKVLAPHLRGFRNNIRNGNSYVLGNVELRIPLFQYLGFSSSRLSFLRNFQIVGFFDTGLAWYGLTPDSSDNPLNTINVSNPPDNPVITVDARYFRDPFVYGFGTGIRTTILGYFLKVDYAWGVDSGIIQDPRLYFSMGFDF